MESRRRGFISNGISTSPAVARLRLLDLLIHASTCRSGRCQYPNCRNIKGLFRHGNHCKTRGAGGCIICKKMWYTLQIHAQACRNSDCNVPQCRNMKEHIRMSVNDAGTAADVTGAGAATEEGDDQEKGCYLGLKIACRNVARVPKSTECFLGKHRRLFGFEREVPIDQGPRVLKSGILIGDKAQSPADKLSKTMIGKNESHAEPKEASKEQGKQSETGKQTQQLWLAPPKIDFKRKSKSKFMKDAQKSLKGNVDTDYGNKVYIPKTIEESKSEEESFGTRVRRVTGESSKKAGDEEAESSEQVGFMLGEEYQKDLKAALELSLHMTHYDKTKPTKTIVDSPEIFISDDNIVNTQDSVEVNMDHAEMTMVTESEKHNSKEDQVEDKSGKMSDNMQDDIGKKHVEGVGLQQVAELMDQQRRRSEHLKEVFENHTMDNATKAAKKRGLEGIEKETLEDAVEKMMQTAVKLLSKKQKKEQQHLKD